MDLRNPLRILTTLDPPKGSAIWNFMISSREAVTKYVSWEVHSGELVHFWYESWNELPPLNQIALLSNSIPCIMNCWGSRLIDYVCGVDLFTGKSIWKDLLDLPIDVVQKNWMQSILFKKIDNISKKHDRLIWAPSKDGKYTIKMGHKALQQMDNQQQTQRDFSFCWNSSALPKVGCFAWLALKNKILTSDNLEKLQIA